MTPTGSLFLLFDVHYDDIVTFMPLRYKNGLVYTWSVAKDRELDLVTGSITIKDNEKVCDDDITVTRLVDKGKGNVDKGKGKMVDDGNAAKSRKSAKSRNNGIVIEENVNSSFSDQDDSDSNLDMKEIFKGNTELEEMFKGNTASETEYMMLPFFLPQI
nr:hypothetical protein [Tanacetum cinerariifolium]